MQDYEIPGQSGLLLSLSGEFPSEGTGGTLVIEELSRDRFRGSFAAQIHSFGAGSAHGSFDVPVHWWR